MKVIKFVVTIVVLFFIAIVTFSQEVESYSETEVSISNDSIMLYGSLLLPNNANQPPVILLIAGSGPTNRDGNQFGMINNSLKFLAEELAKNGIASLRYDKRGIGKSLSNQAEIDLVFEDFISDAIKWIETLREMNKFSKIYIAGHSEGSLIGMVAAQKVTIDGFISIAGPGESIDKILTKQLSGIPEPLLSESKSIIDSLLQEKQVKIINPNLFSLFRPSVQPYLISWFKYNPTEVLGALSIPILIIQGTTDIQVSNENAELLAHSNQGVTIRMIEGMNHVLKIADLEREKNIAAYTNPNLPIAKDLLKAIVDFIEGISY